MRKIEYVVSNERLITPSGLALVGQVLGKSNLIKKANRMTKKPLLFRMDSGNDALENMLLLHWHDPQLKFLIKHNFRREDSFAIAEELKSVRQNVL